MQLADLLHRRWQQHGADLANLDEAVRLLEPAHARRTLGSLWANSSYLLSSVLADRAIVTGSRDDLLRAERLLASLAQSDLPGFGATMAAPAAEARGLIAAADDRDKTAADAFTEALDVIRSQFASQSTRRERAGALTNGQRLPALAATALIKDGRPAQAAVALETGQAMLASESMARATFDVAQVARVDGSLADRLRSAMDQLSQAEKLDMSDPASIGLAGGRAAVATARAEFNTVLDEVRARRGLADCLGPPVVADVLAAAADRPLVYLTVGDHPRHGYALVIPAAAKTSDIAAIPLPGLTQRALLAMLEEAGYLTPGRVAPGGGPAPDAGRSLQSFLDWLGDAVIQPWLDQIGGEPTAIRIVATGWLAQCPLHAATVRGPHGAAPCPLLDRVAVSFAPNARAITLARDRAAARRGRRLLVVGDPQPSSAAPLPLARAEVSQVAAAYPGATVLLADDATLARVHAELPSADVLHLACHGYAVPLHPEASALLLSADERLTLGDLIRSQVLARVVLLSACETAISGFSLPERGRGAADQLLAGRRGRGHRIAVAGARLRRRRAHGRGARPPAGGRQARVIPPPPSARRSAGCAPRPTSNCLPAGRSCCRRPGRPAASPASCGSPASPSPTPVTGPRSSSSAPSERTRPASAGHSMPQAHFDALAAGTVTLRWSPYKSAGAER